MSDVLLSETVAHIWVNIGSSNILLPEDTKSLPEPMLICYHWSLVTIIQPRTISQAIFQPPITKICLKIVSFKMPMYQWIKTHLPLVPHICVNESGQHWFRWWLVAYSAPSHYLNQCLDIVNCTFRNKIQWNFNRNIKFSFTKMHLKISSAIWWPFCPGGGDLTSVVWQQIVKRQ